MRTTKLICILLWAITLFTSCRDEFPVYGPGGPVASRGGKPIEGNRSEGLVPYQYGNEIKWKAEKRRVPLVGVGRVVNRLFPDLIAVAGGAADVARITDTDIDNSAVFGMNLLNLKLGGPLVSVRDMYRTYSAEQQVGFVYRVSNTVNTLDISLLKGLYLRLYKNGKPVGTYEYSEGEGGVLGISLLNLPTGNGGDERVIAVKAKEDFDEVELGTTGIDVGLLSTFEVKYAFVGETPEVPVVEGSEAYPNPSIINKVGGVFGEDYTKIVANPENTVNASLEDNAWFSVPVDLGKLFDPKLAIYVGKEIPAGTEVGFVTKSYGLVGIGLLGKSGADLRTYSYTGKEMEYKESIGSNKALLGLSLLQGSDKQHVNMITKEPCNAIQLTYSSGLIGINLSKTDIFYAYTREATKVDITSYFVIADDETTFSSYHFPIPEEGKVTYEYLGFEGAGDAPTGIGFSKTTPGLLVNMTKEGKYKVQATYRHNGETLVQFATITRKPQEKNEKCNILITADGHGATVPPPSGAEGCLLCVLDGEKGDPRRVIDGNLNTFVEYYSALGLIQNSAMIAVQTEEPVAPAQVDENSGMIRAGFIVQGYSHLLDLSALQYYYIRFYLGEKMVAQKVAELNTTIGLDLIQGGSGDNRMRLCAKIDQPFDRMELWIGGIANVIDRLRIYDAFYEPVSSKNCSGDAAEFCMEMMSPVSHGLELYKSELAGGLVSIGDGMTGLDKILDTDKNSCAILVSSKVVGTTELGLKFNRQKANQTIGVILGKPGSVVDAEVLSAISFVVFDGERRVDWSREGSLLGLDVVSHGDKMYIELTPKEEFDRVSLSFGSLVQLFDNYKVYGLYMRPDINGDGVPDCGEDNNSGDELTILTKEGHACETKDIVIDKVYGPEEGTPFRLTVRTYIPMEERGDFPEEVVFENVPLRQNALTITGEMMKKVLGKYGHFPPHQYYYVNIAKSVEKPDDGKEGPPDGGDNEGDNGESVGGNPGSDGDNESGTLYYNYPVTVHPLRTTWTGAAKPAQGEGGETINANDWNHWDNWEEGTPWKCTEVVIPAGLENYPILKKPEGTAGLEGNFCARIQFLSELDPATGELRTGEVVNPHYLTYGQAFVDTRFLENKYYMLAAPLKDTYTGDIFSDEAYNGMPGRSRGTVDYDDCWKVIGDKTTRLDADFRFTPRVYQHFFGGYVTNITDDGEEQLLPGDKNWTASFNLVAERYKPATGFLVRMGGKTGETRPQAGTKVYRVRFPKDFAGYSYYDESGNLLPREERVRRSPDNLGRFIYEDDDRKVSFPFSVKLENTRPGNTYLAGNPFMCHLDIKTFFDANVAVGGIKVLRATGKYEEVTRQEAMSGTGKFETIRPMEAFLIVLRPPYSETNRYRCLVHFVEPLLTAGK